MRENQMRENQMIFLLLKREDLTKISTITKCIIIKRKEGGEIETGNFKYKTISQEQWIYY